MALKSINSKWASAKDFLDDVKCSEAWLSVKIAMEEELKSPNITLRDSFLKKAHSRIEYDHTGTLIFEYWEIYHHSLEKALEEMWDSIAITSPMLKIILIGIMMHEWITDNTSEVYEEVPHMVNKEVPVDELCHFIHPSITDDGERQKIHREIENLVRNYSPQDICKHLKDLESKEKILLPQMLENAMIEMHRLGMPDENTEGYTKKTFYKYYRK